MRLNRVNGRNLLVDHCLDLNRLFSIETAAIKDPR